MAEHSMYEKDSMQTSEKYKWFGRSDGRLGKKIIFIETNSEIDGFESFLLLHTCTCDNRQLSAKPTTEPVLFPCNDKTKPLYAAVHRLSTLTELLHTSNTTNLYVMLAEDIHHFTLTFNRAFLMQSRLLNIIKMSTSILNDW